MKNFVSLMLPVLLLTASIVSAEEQLPRHRGGERKAVNHHSQTRLPVYASQPAAKGKFEMTPEQRKKFSAARKRRFEIMVLIGAYKIMPADQRQALKAELLKRIEEDFKATMVRQKERIAQAEAELKKLRSELAEKEKNADKLVASELDRLLKIKIPMSGRRQTRPGKNPPGAAGSK